MKLVTKLTMLCVVTLLFVFTSCSKELCYECTGFDDGTTALEDLGTICEGENSATKEEVKAAAATYELLGGTCTKK